MGKPRVPTNDDDPAAEQREGVAMFVRHGLRLVPISGQKRPLIAGWQRRASRRPEAINEWGDRFPDANFAVLTAGSLVVIDVDGAAGVETFDRLVADLGELPDAPTVQTSDGGFHMYFAAPRYANVPTRAGVAEGIDVRADRNGLAVIPGSVHGTNGWVYRWAEGRSLDDVPLPELPDNWLAYLARRPDNPNGGDAAGDDNAAAFVFPTRVPRGERNDALYRYACSVRARGGDDERTMSLVLHANAERCNPPLVGADLDELRATVEGVCRKFDPGFDAARIQSLMRSAEVAVVLSPLSRQLQQVYLAHLRLAHRIGATTYEASDRQIALDAGVAPNTMRACRRDLLRAEVIHRMEGDLAGIAKTKYKIDLSWIEDAEAGIEVDEVDPLIHDCLAGSSNGSRMEPPALDLFQQQLHHHVAFSGHGNLDFGTYVAAMSASGSGKQIAAWLGRPVATTIRRLEALERAGLVERGDEGWTAIAVSADDLDRVADEQGIAARVNERRDRYAAETEQFKMPRDEQIVRPERWPDAEPDADGLYDVRDLD